MQVWPHWVLRSGACDSAFLTNFPKNHAAGPWTTLCVAGLRGANERAKIYYFIAQVNLFVKCSVGPNTAMHSNSFLISRKL